MLAACRHMQQQVGGQLSSKWRDCQASLQSELKLINSLEKDKAAFGTANDTAGLPANRSAQVCPETDLAAVHSNPSNTTSTCAHFMLCLQPAELSHTSAWQSRRSEPDEGFQPDFTIHVVSIFQTLHIMPP